MIGWLLVAVPGIALANTVLNLLWWPRGRIGGPRPDPATVAIPARNEERNITASVRAALASDPPVPQVLVADDHSTDDTPALLRGLAAEDDRLQVVHPPDLPPGWVGKPHACHHLARAATGDWIVFVDADTVLQPDGLHRLMDLARRYRADVVTAVPQQRTVTLPERWILPLLHLTYTAWLPQILVWATADPRFLAANGQVLAISREAYDAIGGFESVRGAVVDDMALCARAKRAGRRVVFADGHHIATCRMYRSMDEIWRGFSKNIYRGLGSPVALSGALALYLSGFVLPYVALGAGLLALPGLVVPAAVAVGLNLALRGLLALRHGHSVGSVLAHPLAVLALCAIALNSFRWHRRGAVAWAGRIYRHGEGA